MGIQSRNDNGDSAGKKKQLLILHFTETPHVSNETLPKIKKNLTRPTQNTKKFR